MGTKRRKSSVSHSQYNFLPDFLNISLLSIPNPIHIPKTSNLKQSGPIFRSCFVIFCVRLNLNCRGFQKVKKNHLHLEYCSYLIFGLLYFTNYIRSVLIPWFKLHKMKLCNNDAPWPSMAPVELISSLAEKTTPYRSLIIQKCK